jgi:hypothetical protein
MHKNGEEQNESIKKNSSCYYQQKKKWDNERLGGKK